MYKTHTFVESHYVRDNRKWFFAHGTKQWVMYFKKENVRIKNYRITLATNRTGIRAFEKSDEMGLMAQMLKDFKGDFSDDFWKEYNYIPLDSTFKSALTRAKNP